MPVPKRPANPPDDDPDRDRAPDPKRVAAAWIDRVTRRALDGADAHVVVVQPVSPAEVEPTIREWMTVREAARKLRVDRTTIWRLITRGALVKVEDVPGREACVTGASVEEFIASRVGQVAPAEKRKRPRKPPPKPAPKSTPEADAEALRRQRRDMLKRGGKP